MPAQDIRQAVKIGTKNLLADQETLIHELRDFAASRTMALGESATARELFDDLFAGIGVCKGEKPNG